jgi:ribonuclease VapC
MVVDTSAWIAILFSEPEGADFMAKIAASENVRVSAASAFEVSIVAVGRSGPAIESEVDTLFTRCSAEIVPLTIDQVSLARQAFLNFGKGRGHPARLNFGDCFSYALAKHLDEPLLFKGNDFARTDIVAAL